MTKLSRDKAIFWTLVGLFALVVLRVFSSEVINKGKWVETNAIIVTKDYRDRPYSSRNRISDRKIYHVDYIYAFDPDKALSYRSPKSLERGLKTHRKFQNYTNSDYNYFEGQIDLSSMVLETQTVDISTYRLLSAGQNITIDFRADSPWESRITKWNGPSE